jgi:hypothetical protein
MSNSALNTVFDRSCSQGAARLVMLSIADRADDEGRAYCGATDLCRRTRVNRATVFQAIKKLREIGELQVLPEKGRKGCNRYRITVNQSRQATSRMIQPVASDNASSRVMRPKPIRTPNKEKAEPIMLPHGEAFADALQDFAAFREEIRKPLTATAARRIVAKLSDLAEPEAVAAMDKSIRNGWQDVYPQPNGKTAAIETPCI